MESVEYFERPLAESGTVNAGDTEVWFKDFVHDVRPTLSLDLSVASHIYPTRASGRNSIRDEPDDRFHQPNAVSSISSRSASHSRRKIYSSSYPSHSRRFPVDNSCTFGSCKYDRAGSSQTWGSGGPKHVSHQRTVATCHERMSKNVCAQFVEVRICKGLGIYYPQGLRGWYDSGRMPTRWKLVPPLRFCTYFEGAIKLIMNWLRKLPPIAYNCAPS
jgi:hypothetical protein